MNGNMLLSPDALHCLKRKQLTNLCRRFGIKAVGKNADLIRQLQEYAASNIPSDSPTKGNVPILRHVKRPRQSDSSQESGTDDLQTIDEKPESASLPYPPLTPRTRQKRVSDMVKAIEDVKQLDDDMDTDDDDDENATLSQRNTIIFPVSSPAPIRSVSPLAPSIDTDASENTQPLRIIKALPSSNRLAPPLCSATILEMNRPTLAGDGSFNLYPDLSTLPLPDGVSSDCLASSSTLPSITSRQFSAAAASVLADVNARLTAAGRSATSGSLTTMSSIGNGTWQNLAASASSQGMSKSRSGRYEIHHERQFNKMDSIVNHYAARRVGAGATSSSTDSRKSAASNSSGPSVSTAAATASSVTAARMTASTSTSRRTRVDASTSTRSLAAMTRSTSARKVPVQRRPLPTPPVSSARSPPPTTLPHSTTRAQIVQLRHASNNTVTTNASSDPPRAKRLRLAVSEDQDASQNTVLEIPPGKKTVVIRVTRPDREGMPYKFSVASSSTADIESAPTRAASSLRKTVIKATKGTFAASSGSAKKGTTSAKSQKREAAFVKQQQQQAAMSRSISSRANLASTGGGGLTASAGTRNRFTGVTTMTNPTATPLEESNRDVRKPSAAVSAMSGSTEASKHSSISSRFGGSIRSSVSQGLGRAEMARQARLKEIKARTKAALAGFGSQRNVSATATVNEAAPASPDKPVASTFSPSVMRPTIASLNRSAGSNASASLPMLSAITRSAAPTLVTETLQRAATIHAGVGKVLTPCLTPRSSSLRHLRRVMRKQQKEADLEQVRVAAAENIAPGDVVPSVLLGPAGVNSAQSTISKQSVLMAEEQDVNPSIRTVATRAASPNKMHSTTPRSLAARPAGPRTALVASRATTSALNRL
ncbi:hypothetical protein PHSY_001076 [Pseudozyma hubeiensis SY62]|uniref:SAP domain-containing protein n=1 Tax=Pseudozyma hubeiensis (strain SY62) TaxID=1305764 RepID=R9NY02_PSEHS|nr:hypothetical protein PHSY_001076 [Pseudozyma hubeiensis SY62]GAC93511.1 hypothetical protein PHSY_001076 [Pseudozyma hubeiensis SY62]